ncbi:MAG: NYN domain-containing protein, partial [Xanthomonadales bacterium]|nr:NYN domain-containing protein [Xanthomonadales bacterium]
CIVSSDSDFTRIAMRVRESGLTVYGFGERKTPTPFVAACDKFIYTDILVDKDDETDAPARQTKAASQVGKDRKLASLLRKAVEASSDDSGWANLSPVGSYIAKQTPDFDPRNYGFRKLRELVAASKLFDIEERVVGAGPGKSVYLRERRKSSR